jgi:hypothetical protein
VVREDDIGHFLWVDDEREIFREGTKHFLNPFKRRRSRNTNNSPRWWTSSWVILLVLATVIAAGGSWLLVRNGAEAESPYRAFTSSSYWNTPLPADAPAARRSRRILAFIRRIASTNYVHLSGTTSTGRWGNPIYWSDPDDTAYDIRNSCSFSQPPEFSSVRIPSGAKPDPTSDSAMTVYDLSKNIVYGFHLAAYNDVNNSWSACGGAVYYLGSNGLDGDLKRSDHPANGGHRGLPPPTFAVRFDEVQSGTIDHVLKIAVPRTKCRHVFPMTGNECGTSKKFAPPEGTRIRIKPTVDLSTLSLSPEALTIARALQTYGAVIGDQSGGPVSLKLENVVAEGRGHLWDGLLDAESLASIPLGSFEVIRLGFDPTINSDDPSS